jgi:hypothetical protein
MRQEATHLTLSKGDHIKNRREDASNIWNLPFAQSPAVTGMLSSCMLDIIRVIFRKFNSFFTENKPVSQSEKKSPLILFGKTVAVYCENHMEQTDIVRTSQETHYVSGTEPNRLMLFRETVAVYCENHT